MNFLKNKNKNKNNNNKWSFYLMLSQRIEIMMASLWFFVDKFKYGLVENIFAADI